MGSGSGIREKPIPDPGSRGQKGTESRIPDTGSRIRIRNTGYRCMDAVETGLIPQGA
jgi:hypothetical protein